MKDLYYGSGEEERYLSQHEAFTTLAQYPGINGKDGGMYKKLWDFLQAPDSKLMGRKLVGELSCGVDQVFHLIMSGFYFFSYSRRSFFR